MPVCLGWGTDDGGDASVVAGEDELADGVYVQSGMFHVDEQGVDAGHLAHHGDFIARDKFDGHEGGYLAIEDARSEGVVEAVNWLDGAHDGGSDILLFQSVGSFGFFLNARRDKREII